MENLYTLLENSGLYQLDFGSGSMIVVGLLLLYLAIVKKFEPLLLLPIGFGAILSNIPGAGLALSAVGSAIYAADPEVLSALANSLNLISWESASDIYDVFKESSSAEHALAVQTVTDLGYRDGMLYTFYTIAIASGLAPLIIFMGVGAMTDFGPLLANPKTLLLGAAAQFGIFATLLGAIALTSLGVFDFSLQQAAAIGIIGGADGPTSIYVASKLAPELLGAIAVASYSYMALVPLIQPPIMRLFTTEKERQIQMVQLREVSKTEKIVFPIMLVLLVGLLLPDAAPLLGMFAFGNLMKECGVVDRLSDTTQNALINIVTIFLGLAVGSKLIAVEFLKLDTLGILLLGMVAFAIGTMSGLLMAKLMNALSHTKINPLIGSAGVSAVPMAARVSNRVGLESNPQNFLLMHAMGPNVAGVIGSAIAAGIMIQFLG